MRDLLLYRPLDTTNYTKSVDSILSLLAVLDCEAALVVKDRPATGVLAGDASP